MTRLRPLALAALAALAALGLAGLAGCGGDEPPSAAAATATAAAAETGIELRNCDRTIALAAPPQRAVAISQPAIELLLTLGLADRMAGAAGWNDPVLPSLAAENEKVEQLGRDFPSFERTLDADPDLVYTTFAYGFTDEGTAPRERFDRLGVATYLSPSECAGQGAEQTSALRFDDVFSEVRDIATLFAVEERGEELVGSLEQRLDRAAGGLDADGVSLAWWYAATKAPYIAGCCGAPGMITERVGAENAFADSRQLWPETSWEAILERDPDVLVLADLTRGGDGDSAEAKIRFLQRDPVASRLTAVRDRRWIVVTGSDMDPSLRNVDAVEKVADGLRRIEAAGR